MNPIHHTLLYSDNTQHPCIRVEEVENNNKKEKLQFASIASPCSLIIVVTFESQGRQELKKRYLITVLL